MTNNPATHYIATDADRSAIYGLGDSPEAAIADALAQCAELAGLIAVPCSASLAAEIEGRGGAIAWDERDGMAYPHGYPEGLSAESIA